jgi:cytochrome P450
MPIEQAAQHAGAGRFRDGARNAGKVVVCIHVSLSNELFMIVLEDTAQSSTTQRKNMHDEAIPADPIAAVTHPDPYPYYAALASCPTLVHDGRLGLWVAAHPDLVREVMANPACRVRPLNEQVPAAIAGPAGEVFGALVRMNDGQCHAVRKAALKRALDAVTDDMAAQGAAHVAALLLGDGMGDADRLNRFVTALPVCTIAHLLGFDDAQLPAVAAWTGQFVACLSALSDERQVAQSHLAAHSLLAALRALAAQPRRATGMLADAGAAGWEDEHALLSNLLGLLSQTFEATAGLLGNCIVALLGGADPGGVVQRTMHADPAIHNTRRFAASDIGIGGVTVGAGQTILLVLAAQEAEHGFGYGRHACPGQALARTIVAQGVQALSAAGALPRVSWRYRVSMNARLPQFMEQPQ